MTCSGLKASHKGTIGQFVRTKKHIRGTKHNIFGVFMARYYKPKGICGVPWDTQGFPWDVQGL